MHWRKDIIVVLSFRTSLAFKIFNSYFAIVKMNTSRCHCCLFCVEIYWVLRVPRRKRRRQKTCLFICLFFCLFFCLFCVESVLSSTQKKGRKKGNKKGRKTGRKKGRKTECVFFVVFSCVESVLSSTQIKAEKKAEKKDNKKTKVVFFVFSVFLFYVEVYMINLFLSTSKKSRMHHRNGEVVEGWKDNVRWTKWN